MGLTCYGRSGPLRLRISQVGNHHQLAVQVEHPKAQSLCKRCRSSVLMYSLVISIDQNLQSCHISPMILSKLCYVSISLGSFVCPLRDFFVSPFPGEDVRYNNSCLSNRFGQINTFVIISWKDIFIFLFTKTRPKRGADDAPTSSPVTRCFCGAWDSLAKTNRERFTTREK